MVSGEWFVVFPQGLKPQIFLGLIGTAKAVPFPRVVINGKAPCVVINGTAVPPFRGSHG